MSDSSEPPPLVSSSKDEDEVSDRSSDSSRFAEFTSHQLRNYALLCEGPAFQRTTVEWVRLVTDEGGTDGSPRDSGAPLLPAIAEHLPGPNTEARSLGGRVEWGAEWDAGWRGDSSWQEDAGWRGDSSWQEWRGWWWYRDASGGWVEWQNPWRVEAHMPA